MMGVEQLNLAMGNVDQVTQKNAAVAEELSATAEEMEGQARSLSGLSEGFWFLGRRKERRLHRAGERRSNDARGRETPRAVNRSGASGWPGPLRSASRWRPRRRGLRSWCRCT